MGDGGTTGARNVFAVSLHLDCNVNISKIALKSHCKPGRYLVESKAAIDLANGCGLEEGECAAPFFSCI